MFCLCHMLKFVLSNLDCFNKNYNSFSTSKLLSFDAPSSKIVNATTRVFRAGHGAVSSSNKKQTDLRFRGHRSFLEKYINQYYLRSSQLNPILKEIIWTSDPQRSPFTFLGSLWREARYTRRKHTQKLLGNEPLWLSVFTVCARKFDSRLTWCLDDKKNNNHQSTSISTERKFRYVCFRSEILPFSGKQGSYKGKVV